MFQFSSTTSGWFTRLVQGLLGMLGFYAAIRLLPRVLKSMTRRFLFGLVGEILLVALGLFLTRRAAEEPSPPSESTNGEQQASRTG
ncbi:MAG: hypothetical protein BRD55_00715 [Bacteroidetes bacterium SW_9_63_38]|nr:MAG: hypothetical protein BRD55_00715 [Bacteroidetes bacterium SW_9_63_38]